MTDINPAISIIYISIYNISIIILNGLNNPINRQKLSNWIGNMIQLFTVYRRSFLGSKIQID